MNSRSLRSFAVARRASEGALCPSLARRATGCLALGFYLFLAESMVAAPPAPVVVEVVADYSGATAEEVERQVTIPLEVTLAGMPGLEHLRSQSRFGLSVVRVHFKKTPAAKARQESADPRSCSWISDQPTTWQPRSVNEYP